MSAPRYDVFLSHANADKADIEFLARRLRDQGIEVFLDAWHQIPGDPWQEAVEDALDQSRTCAIFLGRTIGPWQNEEMRSALETRVRDRGFRVIPILLPGGIAPGTEKLPRFLRRLTWVDFRKGLDDEVAFRRLVAGIRGVAPGPKDACAGEHEAPMSASFRSMAPPRESFIPRREYEEVIATLLEPGAGQQAAMVGLTTALHGAGGFGKTALAQETCHDPRIRSRFPDGVLWTTMGDQMTETARLARLRDLIRWWTTEEPPAFETVSVAGAHLREVLEGRRILLVIDDVWDPEDVVPFQGLGSGAGLVLTTRDSRTLPERAVAVQVDAMEVPEAVQLLGTDLPPGAPSDLAALAKRLGEWPILLKIVNRQLRELVGEGLSLERALREVGEALDAEGLTAFDQKDFESRREAVARTLTPSLRRLDPEEIRRFNQLAIFPEDSDISVSVLAKLWGLQPFPAKRLCARLHDRSLLLRFDRLAGTVRLHDVIRAYLLKSHEESLAETHRQLLTACRPESGRWADLPPEEKYLWQHLSHHLQGAGELTVLRRHLLEPDFLQAKLEATDVSALLADFAWFREEDRTISLVRDAIWLAAPVLSRDAIQLAGQLQGRLLGQKEEEIQRLLREMRLGSERLWLCPRFASLKNPGTALIRTLQGDHGGVTAITALDDHRIVSGSTRGSLVVWGLDTGEKIKMLQVCEGEVSHLAAIDSSRVALISNAPRGKLQIWNLDYERPMRSQELGASRMALLDERRLLVACSDVLRILDLETSLEICAFKHPRRVTALAILQNGLVVSSCLDGVLRIMASDGLVPLRSILTDPTVRTLAALGSELIVAGCLDGFLRIVAVETGEVLSEHRVFSADVRSILALPGLRFVAGSGKGDLLFQDLDEPRRKIFKESSFEINSLAILSGSRVAAGSPDGMIRVWSFRDYRDTDEKALLPSPGIQALAVLPKERAVSGAEDGTLRVWDLESGSQVRIMKDTTTAITAIAVLDDRRVIAGTSSGALVVWNLGRAQVLQRLSWQASKILGLAVLDVDRVASLSSSENLVIHDLTTGAVIRRRLASKYEFEEISTLLSDGWVIWRKFGLAWQLMNLRSDRAVEFTELSQGITALTLLDDHWLVTGLGRGFLEVFDLTMGCVSDCFKGHSSRVRALASLWKGSFASGSDDGTLSVWNVGNPSAVATLTLDHEITSIAFSPDDGGIVVGDARGQVHCFDLAGS